MKITLRDTWLDLAADGDDETLQVKRLPGREYDAARGVWTVPYGPGLAAAFDAAFPDLPSITAAMEEREREYLDSLQAPAVTPADLMRIGTAEAVTRAFDWTLQVKYRGDVAAYNRVYGGRK